MVAEAGLPLVSTNYVQSEQWCDAGPFVGGKGKGSKSKSHSKGHKGKGKGRCMDRFGEPGLPLKAVDETAWMGFTRSANIKVRDPKGCRAWASPVPKGVVFRRSSAVPE